MSDHPQQWQPNQPPPPGAYGPPPKKNWFLRHKILTVLLGLLLIGGVSAAIGGGGQEDTTASSTDDSTDEAADGSADQGEGEAAKPESEQKPSGGPRTGDPVRDGKFEFVVSKVENGPAQLGDEYLNEKAQGRFVLVTVKVTNIGDEARQLSDSNQKLFDGKGRSYEANSTAAILLPDNEVLYENINPGNSVTGTLVFDVPKGAEPTKIELHDSAFSGGITVDLT